MTTETKSAFEGWAILSLFGHNTIAGFVTEQSISGAGFIRVDVPAVDEDHPAFTKFYNPSAVYDLSPTTEDVALHAAMRLRVRPISPYVVPVPPANRQLVDSYGDPGDNDHNWDDVDDDKRPDDDDEDEIGF